MNFKRLRHFVHIAELGSLSRAAERLNIVQPALTQSLQKLEEDLDTKLFNRSRTGMELTDSGKLFLESAYGILNQYDRAKENISAPDQPPTGTVSIAMTASALHVLSVPLCRLLKTSLQGVDLILEEGLAGNIQSGFEAGRYDLVLNYLHQASRATKAEPLIEEDMYLTQAYIGSETTDVISFSDLHEFKLILPNHEHGLREQLESQARKSDIVLNWEPISAALNPTMDLIESGVGSSLLPWAAMYDRVAEKKLTTRKIVSPTITHTISMIYPSNRPPSRATLAVMALIKAATLEVHSEGKWRGRLLFDADHQSTKSGACSP